MAACQLITECKNKIKNIYKSCVCPAEAVLYPTTGADASRGWGDSPSSPDPFLALFIIHAANLPLGKAVGCEGALPLTAKGAFPALWITTLAGGKEIF